MCELHTTNQSRCIRESAEERELISCSTVVAFCFWLQYPTPPYLLFFMKKTCSHLIFLGSVLSASLLPFVAKAEAMTYNPGYTCYYRDISGSCLSYQGSSPYRMGHSYGTYGSSFISSQTYPFNVMYNAAAMNRSPWDNRYSNRYNYPIYRYGEDDDDDNDYFDEGDRAYDDYDRRHYIDNQWRWYYDTDDDRVRKYRYQSGNYYDDGYRSYGRGDNRLEFEHTKVLCTGRDCDAYQYGY